MNFGKFGRQPDGTTNLLLFPQREQTHTGHLHDLESYTRNITLGLARATETRNQNLIVLIDKIEATVVLWGAIVVSLCM